MTKWIGIGTILQTVMVVVGHWVTGIANLFGPLGMLISLMMGLLWAKGESDSFGDGAMGGAVVGGACALIGIAISLLLGDVTALILLLGTLSSAVAGLFGGLIGFKLRPAA